MWEVVCELWDFVSESFGLWNIFLIILSYMLIVIVDNVTHFMFSLAGFDLKVYWPLYMVIDDPIFFYVCGLLSKKAKEMKHKDFLELSPKMTGVIGANLLLCMLIFVIHISITEQAGSFPRLLLASDILYIAYFVLTFAMITMIVREYETNARITMKQHSYDNLQEYMHQIEELYQNMRAFRHDYANIMSSMTAYMNDNDMQGLKEYYEKHILPVSSILNKEKDAAAQLYHLEIVELKGLLSVKINYALERNIKVTLEIADRIKKINMKIIDLVRITGILLDNAIEACQECTEPAIMLGIIKTEQNVAIIVKNTYIKKEIDYSRLGESGFTTKGERRGTGLYYVRNIIREYNHVVLDTEYGESHFTQLLEVYEDDIS